MSKIYSKTPLDKNRKDVRILRMSPGQTSGVVIADLEVVSHDKSPAYIAVSYTWEPENPKKTILLCGETFSVGSNLWALLHAFRETDRPIALWIDAICINQQDKMEKQSQIALMKDIYQRASKTLVWIGEASDGSKTAMDFVRNFRPAQFEGLSTSPEDEPWPALRRLVRRRWWSRLWVLQEVLLSVQPVVCCGQDRVPFEQFVVLRVSEQENRKQHVRDFGGLQLFNEGVPLEGCLLTWDWDRYKLQRGGIPLNEWFSWTMPLNHSVPHDRIFGLLGLATQAEHDNIKVDYDLPIRELYIQASVYSFREQGLRTLHIGYSIRKADVASWVPDWTVKEYVSYFDKWYGGVGAHVKTLADHPAWVRVGGILDIPNWTLPDISYLDPDGCWAISVGRETLAVRAFIFDKITYTDAVPFVDAYEGTDPDEYERRRSQREDAAMDASLRWERHVQSLQGNPYQSSCGRYEAFWRTIIADRRYGQSGPPDTSFPELFEIWMRRKGPQDRIERRKMMFDYYAAAIVHTATRAFVTTEKGYMGLAPGRSNVGDYVVFLKGGPVPFLLRPVENQRYEFVGEAYMHGVMRGEAFTDLALDSLKELWLI